MLEPQTTDSSAMTAFSNNKSATNGEKGTTAEQEKSGQPKNQDKEGLWCTHCKKSRHTRETCWKLHGKPPSREWGNTGGQSQNNGQVHIAAGSQNEGTLQELSGFSQDEIAKVR